MVRASAFICEVMSVCTLTSATTRGTRQESSTDLHINGRSLSRRVLQVALMHQGPYTSGTHSET